MPRNVSFSVLWDFCVFTHALWMLNYISLRMFILAIEQSMKLLEFSYQNPARKLTTMSPVKESTSFHALKKVTQKYQLASGADPDLDCGGHLSHFIVFFMCFDSLCWFSFCCTYVYCFGFTCESIVVILNFWKDQRNLSALVYATFVDACTIKLFS